MKVKMTHKHINVNPLVVPYSIFLTFAVDGLEDYEIEYQVES